MQTTTQPVRYIFLLAAYIGTVFGVGIYGLPYVASRSGTLIFLAYMVVLGFLVYMVNIAYAVVVTGENQEKRFLSYVEEYVGLKAKKVFLVLEIFSYWGVILAFLLVWGSFAKLIISPSNGIPELYYALFLFVITAFIIYRGSKAIVWFDAAFVAGVIVFLGVLMFLGLQHINEIPLHLADAPSALLPYGAILFALWGVNIIPEIVNHTRGRLDQIKRVITVGLIFSAIVYTVFALVVAGISGLETSKEAIENLGSSVGRIAVLIGAVVGVMTIFLSYINLGWSARNMLHFDMKMDKTQALSLILLPPLFLLLIGFHNIVLIIGIIGAILLGSQGIMVFHLYKVTRSKNGTTALAMQSRLIPNWLINIGMVFLGLGVIVEFTFILIDFL